MAFKKKDPNPNSLDAMRRIYRKIYELRQLINTLTLEVPTDGTTSK